MDLSRIRPSANVHDIRTDTDELSQAQRYQNYAQRQLDMGIQGDENYYAGGGRRHLEHLVNRVGIIQAIRNAVPDGQELIVNYPSASHATSPIVRQIIERMMAQ